MFFCCLDKSLPLVVLLYQVFFIGNGYGIMYLLWVRRMGAAACSSSVPGITWGVLIDDETEMVFKGTGLGIRLSIGLDLHEKVSV